MTAEEVKTAQQNPFCKCAEEQETHLLLFKGVVVVSHVVSIELTNWDREWEHKGKPGCATPSSDNIQHQPPSPKCAKENFVTTSVRGARSSALPLTFSTPILCLWSSSLITEWLRLKGPQGSSSSSPAGRVANHYIRAASKSCIGRFSPQKSLCNMTRGLL